MIRPIRLVIWASAWAVASTLEASGGVGAVGGDLVEHCALVGRIALHRLDQVGDEVGAAAKLDGDAAERLADQRAKADQPVVDGNDVSSSAATTAMTIQPAKLIRIPPS